MPPSLSKVAALEQRACCDEIEQLEENMQRLLAALSHNDLERLQTQYDSLYPLSKNLLQHA